MTENKKDPFMSALEALHDEAMIIMKSYNNTGDVVVNVREFFQENLNNYRPYIANNGIPFLKIDGIDKMTNIQAYEIYKKDDKPEFLRIIPSQNGEEFVITPYSPFDGGPV